MSRHQLAAQSAIALAVLCAGLLLAPAATGQEKSVQECLGMQVETKDFQVEGLNLREALNLLYQKFSAKGMDLPILVDIKSFRDDPENPGSPMEDEVRLPAVPRATTLAQALQILLGQVKSNNAAFLVRNGGILITTRENASLQARLREPVAARFDKTPLNEVVQQLSDMIGATILMDPRLKEKAQAPITAEFRGDVTLGAALPVIADMAELRVVNMDHCLYVTTPTNAETLEQRLRERREETLREKERQENLKAKQRI
jgi:hypothetical protein